MRGEGGRGSPVFGIRHSISPGTPTVGSSRIGSADSWTRSVDRNGNRKSKAAGRDIGMFNGINSPRLMNVGRVDPAVDKYPIVVHFPLNRIRKKEASLSEAERFSRDSRDENGPGKRAESPRILVD